MSESTRKLIGLADPGGMSLGFLVPLFIGGSSNAPLVQRISLNGTIEAFEAYEVPDAPTLEAPPWEALVGGPAVHAFAFGKGDLVIVEGDTGRDELLARIDDPVLHARPMLAMEVAELLGMHDLKCDLASRAHALMRKASDETANTWRDLSVLTPELRRALARSDWRASTRLVATVVARVRRDVVEIFGVGDELSASQLSGLRKAAFEATSRLATLYPPPADGWRVQVRKLVKRKPHHQAEAAVLLASTRARGLARAAPWPAVPDLDIHTEDGNAFTRVVEETETPLFIVYDTDEPEDMRKAMGDWTVREMHGIALDSARARVDRNASPGPWSSTHVPTTGIGGGARSEVAGIRLAVAVELDRAAQQPPFSARSAVLMRSRGTGPDPEADAWAALYDRAWAMGLAPWRAMLIPNHGGRAKPRAAYSEDYSSSYASEREPEWAAHALFHKPVFLEGAMTARVLAELRTTGALLVAREQRTEEDLGRHRASITRLLERQRWGIEDDDFRRPDARLIAKGRRAEFQLMVRPNGILQPQWKQSALFEIDLTTVDRLLVSGPASPGEVLSHLAGSGELVVGMRDLTTIDAASATPLTIVAAQLRRQVTGLPSSARTHLVALVAMQALRVGTVDDGGRDLLHLVEGAALGRDVHLAVMSTRMVDGALVARIKVMDGIKARGTRWREIGGFVMSVAPDAVSITSADLTGDE